MNNPIQNSEVLIGDYIKTLKKKHKIKKSEYLPDGTIPVIDQGQEFIAGYINEAARTYDGQLPVIVFGDHTCTLKYVDFPFAVGADGTQLIHPTKDFDIRYFYYALRNLPLEHFGYQRHFKYLKTSKVFCPPMLVQRKIAAILSAYDDLIENNTRRIKILEDMAQTLYREWFVHFRFPGHENVPMVESPLGPIPQGWEVKSFGEVSLNFDRQRKPLSGKIRPTMQGEYPYYGAAKVLDYINDYLFDGRYLLIGEDGSVITEDGKPVLQLVTGKFWVNNHTHVVQGRLPISTNFLYLSMSNVAILGYVTGAAQPKINQQNLNRIPIISSPQNLLEKFEQLIEPCFDKINALNLKNANLSQTRDLLLPKLISGEIGVSDLDVGTDGIQPTKSGTHIPYPLTERLHADEKILDGKPVVKGTRLAVAFILDLLKQGWSEEEVVENYPSVAPEDIEACRAYQQQVTGASISR